MFNIIAATDVHGVIGDEGTIPWRCKKDLEFFKTMTLHGCVIMGRKTWESLPVKPLPERINIVVSSTLKPNQTKMHKDYYVTCDFQSAYELATSMSTNKIFVIGGKHLYMEALIHPCLNKVYLTRLPIECQKLVNPVYFPEIKLDPTMCLTNTSVQTVAVKCNKVTTVTPAQFETYERKSADRGEQGYLNLLTTLINHGDYRNTRNGQVASMFSYDLSFDLQHHFPLLTTKRLPWNMIVKELFHFVNGSTDAKQLQEQNIHIWDGNTSREFLDKVGLEHYQEGDMGPMYGFQWNHFGAKYQGCDHDYTNQGFNQLQYVMETLEKDPMSRRSIMTTFNPQQSDQGCLYPCHGITVQFYVLERHNVRYLDCKMYQRSADAFLGLPFNIASYGFLMHMMCATLTKRSNITYKPRKLHMSLGDVHVYEEHFSAVKEQITREPFIPPTVSITPKESLYQYDISDFVVNDYHHHPAIRAKMKA